MNSRLWFALAVIACLVVVALGQKSETGREPLPVQRYQFMPVRLGEMGAGGDTVFMLDTKEGRVWRYQSAARLPNGQVFDESFTPIGINGPIAYPPNSSLTEKPMDK
jgi:hypothetical protein